MQRIVSVLYTLKTSNLGDVLHKKQTLIMHIVQRNIKKNLLNKLT